MFANVSLNKILQQKLARFIISGGSAACTEYLVFYLLHSLGGVHIILANSISFCCGLIVSFSLNKLWVFKVAGNSKVQFGSYLALALVNLCISNALIWVAVEVLTIPALIAKLTIMITIAVWNYLIFSRFIFARREQ